jgi:pimeloyl-ACP methyl ester carboxylesterase
LSDFSSDIVAVMDHLDLKKAHYIGYSMGEWMGYGLAKNFPARLIKLIIGGSQPYGRNFVNAREILKLGIEGWVSEIREWGPYSSKDLERYLKNDPEALRAALNDREDISEILPTMTMPCLFYAGELDNDFDLIKSLVDHVPNSSFLSLPGLNHIETFIRGNLVAPHLLEFLIS